jgi:triosephosphate isomerase
MTRQRRRFVVGNWKMNKTPREAAAFVTDLLAARDEIGDGVDCGVAPAFPALERVARLLGPTTVRLGAQDVYTEASGAFTGEVSAAMLADIGVSFTLVGHSERRRERGEDEAEFSRKMKRLLETGIAPLYCVGETLDERDGGKTEEVLARQVTAIDLFPGKPPDGLVVAYEPVWAIGTGRSATPALAADAHRFLRRQLASRYGAEVARATRILYGGSVTPANAPDLFAEDEVDGALVGGASLRLPEFLAIVRAAA